MLTYSVPHTNGEWVVFGVIFACIIALSAFSALQHRRRRAAITTAARELGLEFVDVKSPDAAYIHQPIKGQRGHKLRLCAVGIVQDRAARLAEFTFQTGSGRSTRTHHNLQLSVECPESWPAIHLCDRPDLMHRPISELFRPAKAVTDDATFEKRWRIQGPGADRAATALTPALRTLLLQGPRTEFWSIQDGWLTCTWRRACKARDLPGLVARTREVRGAMAAALGQ